MGARRGAACLVLVATAARAADAPPTDDVVVHGARPAAGPRDDTAASTVVAGEALEAPGTSSADVLARVPGVEVSRTGSSSDLATAAIRGATSAETPVYLAGIRLNDDVTGTADLSTIPLFMIDRVEVYRGNAPLAADRLGIGGAVFFEPRFPSKTQVTAGLGAGSFGERAAWATAAAGDDHAAALFAIRHDGAENDFPYRDDDGNVLTRHNADFEATDAWALARFRFDDGIRVTALAHAYDRDQGSPGVAPLENDAARTRVERLQGAVSARIPCGHDAAGVESCALELVTSGIHATSVVTDPLGTLVGGPFVATTGERLEQEARVTARAGDAWTFGGSAVVSDEHIDLARPSATTRAGRITLRPAATASFRPISTTELVATGTVECHSTASGDESTSACPSPEPSGRVGLRQTLGSAAELRGNVGYYVRVPTLGELYGVSTVVRGNPALVPESGATADLGVHAHGEAGRLGLNADVFGFARSVEDLVAYRQNVLGVIVPYNVGHARVLGAEIAASANWSRFVRTELAATLMDPRDTTPDRTVANDILPFRSRLVLSDFTELYAEDGVPRFGVNRASIGVRLTERTSRYADEAGLIVIPEQTIFDVEGSLHFWNRRLAVRLAVRDVFDAREVDAIGLPLPGRGAYASLEARVP